MVLGTLACLLFIFRVPAREEAKSTATDTPSSVLSLPTASVSTATPGPPAPHKVIFAAEEPIKGFSNCNSFGFRGLLTTSNGNRLQGVQIVVWEDQIGLLALNNTDAEGNYLIEIDDSPAQHTLWVQIYENDLPVSRPVFIETQIDCQNGFQVYQIDWRRINDQ
jgi:hypothetical protein